MQRHVVLRHAVRAAQVAGAVTGLGGRVLLRLPEVSSVVGEVVGETEQVDLTPEDRLRLLESERYEVAGQKGGGEGGDVGSF